VALAPRFRRGAHHPQAQLIGLLTADQDGFANEARDVLRGGPSRASWITQDDTGARHKGTDGFRTKIGNDDFAWSAPSAPRAASTSWNCCAPATTITSSTTSELPDGPDVSHQQLSGE
jgi:hypothetical protein